MGYQGQSVFFSAKLILAVFMVFIVMPNLTNAQPIEAKDCQYLLFNRQSSPPFSQLSFQRSGVVQYTDFASGAASFPSTITASDQAVISAAYGSAYSGNLADLVTVTSDSTSTKLAAVRAQTQFRAEEALERYHGGASVTLGDIVFDSLLREEIIVSPQAGSDPVVTIYRTDGIRFRKLHEFMPYGPSFRGGIRVATGDVDGDGAAEIITAPGPGMQPLIKTYDCAGTATLSCVEVNSFVAFDSNFLGGVFVAAGDLTADEFAEIAVTPGAGGGPILGIFNPSGDMISIAGVYDAAQTGGVHVAIADVTGDLLNEVIVANHVADHTHSNSGGTRAFSLSEDNALSLVNISPNNGSLVQSTTDNPATNRPVYLDFEIFAKPCNENARFFGPVR